MKNMGHVGGKYSANRLRNLVIPSCIIGVHTVP